MQRGGIKKFVPRLEAQGKQTLLPGSPAKFSGISQTLGCSKVSAGFSCVFLIRDLLCFGTFCLGAVHSFGLYSGRGFKEGLVVVSSVTCLPLRSVGSWQWDPDSWARAAHWLWVTLALAKPAMHPISFWLTLPFVFSSFPPHILPLSFLAPPASSPLASSSLSSFSVSLSVFHHTESLITLFIFLNCLLTLQLIILSCFFSLLSCCLFSESDCSCYKLECILPFF